MPPVTPLLVLDASVLIDIADVRLELLSTVRMSLGRTAVPAPVLHEVDQIDRGCCASLGLEVVEPTLGQLAEAAAPLAGLSEEDMICLIIARDSGGICVTSDGALFNTCGRLGIPCWRGLRLLLKLAECGALEVRTAIAVVRDIRAINVYVTPDMVRAFAIEALAIQRSQRRR